MMSGLMDGFQAWAACDGEPRHKALKLECSVSGPADPEEIEAAWPGQVPDPEAVRLWVECREAFLFRDVDYGQWGLQLLPPNRSSARTAAELSERPSDFRAGDIVLGEFLGDQELLVLAPSEVGTRRILVALPLDPRLEWYAGGENL